MRAAEARLAADGSMLMTAQAIADLRAHAIEACPEEAVGVVLADGSYRPMVNASPDPTKAALLRRPDYIDLLTAGQLRALCHTHPFGPDCPSEPDMITQIEMAIPFVLCSTDGQATTEPFAWGDQLVDDADYVGRPYRHAVRDCYDLIRLWCRRERGIIIPQIPRQWEWWLNRGTGTKDLYQRFFEYAGFWRIAPEEVRPGDFFIAQIRSAVPNHAGIYIDEGLCLHHLSSGLAHDPSRLSRREPMARWMPYVTHWLRR